jgi:hypothetical protein
LIEAANDFQQRRLASTWARKLVLSASTYGASSASSMQVWTSCNPDTVVPGWANELYGRYQRGP